ncbi:transposase [Burkholderia lata]|nr:transposase [Burkholderia lata]
MLLKVFQQLHYFPPLDTIPTAIVGHVRAAADIGDIVQFGYDTASSPTLFRHYTAVRTWLDVKPYYGTDANAIATRAAHTASLTMDQQVDIINATIDEWLARDIELPAFSTLDRLTEQIHARAQSRLFKRVTRCLTDEQKLALDRLLARDLSSRQTACNRIKRHAKRPSRQHLSLLIDQIAWLDDLGDFSLASAGIPASKLRSLANQAMALDAAALRNDTLPEKRYTLIVALLNRMRVRARDDLADMFVRRMGAIHKRASGELDAIQRKQHDQVSGVYPAADVRIRDGHAQRLRCAYFEHASRRGPIHRTFMAVLVGAAKAGLAAGKNDRATGRRSGMQTSSVANAGAAGAAARLRLEPGKCATANNPRISTNLTVHFPPTKVMAVRLGSWAIKRTHSSFITRRGQTRRLGPDSDASETLAFSCVKPTPETAHINVHLRWGESPTAYIINGYSPPTNLNKRGEP